MKEYKEVVMKELEKLSEDYCAVLLRTAAESAGVKRLPRQECLEILTKFIKNNPDYKIYRLTGCKHRDFFSTAFVSCNESPPYPFIDINY